VPSDFAVEGINCISPVAPLPAAFFIEGEKVLPVSNAIQEIKKSGFTSSFADISSSLRANSFDVFFVHANTGINKNPV
jgi:hypothetical protein